MFRLSFVALLLAGCSSEASAPPPMEPSGPSGDSIVMTASDETRSVLGVVTWEFPLGESGQTIMNGYDASHQRIVEFRQASNSPNVFEATLQTKAIRAKMKLEGGTDPSRAKMLENTFTGDPEAERALARIIRDLETQRTTLAPAHGTGSLASALEPRGTKLVNTPSCLVKSCSLALTSSASAGANAVSDCGNSGASSNGCATRVREVSRSQNQSASTCNGSSSGNTQSSNMPMNASSCAPELANGAVPALERALLDTIAYAEGTANSTCGNEGYSTGFGFNCFESCAQHPNIHYPYGSTTSTAAGRYQFLDKTWSGLNKPDFGPANQDRAAMDLVRRRGVQLPADRALNETEFNDAINKLSCEWASLPPGCNYGQPNKTLPELRGVYCSKAGCDGC